jgi:hypothetical protein
VYGVAAVTLPIDRWEDVGVSDDNSDLSRDPPAAVKRALRQEVGFGCPMRDAGTDYCGSPYLQYHHFDPPWRIEQHHRPDGMIALCATHHGVADALTVEQCRELKATALDRVTTVQSRFQWMRNDLFLIMGSNYFLNPTNIVSVKGDPLLWLSRNDDGYVLVNVHTPDAQRNPRVSLLDNDWTIRGDPTDVETPPGGKSLSVKYADGDRLKIRFHEWQNEDELTRWHPAMEGCIEPQRYPITSVVIWLKLKGLGFVIGQNKATIRGRNRYQFTECVNSATFTEAFINL